MKRKYRQLAAVLVFLVCLSGCAMSPQKETQKVREASTQAVMEEGVIPGGMPVGIYMEMDGVMVLGTDQITGADGKTVSAGRESGAAGRLYCGME